MAENTRSLAAIKGFEALVQQRLDQNTTLLDETTTRWDRSLYDMQGKITDISSQLQQQNIQSAQIQKQLQHIFVQMQGNGNSSVVASPISLSQPSLSLQPVASSPSSVLQLSTSSLPDGIGGYYQGVGNSFTSTYPNYINENFEDESVEWGEGGEFQRFNIQPKK